MDPDSIDKTFQIDDHIGVAISGLHADSRSLINYSRVQAQSYRLTYDEPVRVNMLVKTIADLCQIYTQYGGIRPFGCALFFIGIDSTGTHIYTTSPSGIYRPYKAYALGSGDSSAREYIQNNYNEKLSFKEMVNLALNSIKESIDEEISEENIRIAYIKSSEGSKYKNCSKDEVKNYITALE